MNLDYLHKLYRYLAEWDEVESNDYIGIDDKEIFQLFTTETERKKDECHVTFSYNKDQQAFQIEVSSWSTSYHNGDPYGVSERNILLVNPLDIEGFGEGQYLEETIMENAFKLIETELERTALQKADKEFRALEEEQRLKRLKSFLKEKLRYV